MCTYYWISAREKDDYVENSWQSDCSSNRDTLRDVQKKYRTGIERTKQYLCTFDAQE